jgi:hypothetical protein
MRIATSVTLLITGMLAGIILVLSCGDNSPSNADAATCDCPVAELPIAGRLVRINQTTVIPPNTTDVASTGCPPGGLLISGSCTDTIPELADLTLQQSGFIRNDEQGWNCAFRNNNMTTSVTIKATAICLMPAS